MVNRTHLLVAFALCLIAVVVLALAPSGGEVGGRLGLIDALTGLLLIIGGAVAGAQVPKD
jgi:hypothetical protein